MIWRKSKVSVKVPYYKQQETYTCGPASMQMIFDYFRYYQSQNELAKQMGTNKERGTDNDRLVKTATSHGFFCYVNNNSSFDEIRHFLGRGLPSIVNFIEPINNEIHFAVVSGLTRRSIILNDPWNGKNFKMLRKDFLDRWHDSRNIHKEWIMVVARDSSQLGRYYFPSK